MGFQQGLSGLNTSAKNLDVIGNNIANVSTVGFKSSRAEFADVYAASIYGSSSLATGVGTKLMAVNQQYNQGNITVTNSPLDIAINGNGFFKVVGNSIGEAYTRNGQFHLDGDGYIVTSNGFQLQGLPWDQVNGTFLGESAIQVQVTGVAQATGSTAPAVDSGVTMAVNLDATSTLGTAPAGPSNYGYSTSMNVYDSQGGEQALTIYFLKTDATTNAWDVQFFMDIDADGVSDDLTAAGMANGGSIQFLGDGTYDAANSTQFALNVTLPNGTDPLVFDVDLSSSTQFAASSGVNSVSQDGRPPGKFTGLAISNTGLIEASYDNGQSITLGQLNLYTFANPNGLQPIGNNVWLNTVATGGATANNPGSGVAGTVQSGALEESNVDLTAELVNLIVAQRTYQANAQTIRAQDQILQTLVNLR